MTRDEALREYQQETYSPEEKQADLEFVCKKLRISEKQFEEFMQSPPRNHQDFAHQRRFLSRYPIFKALLPVWHYYKRKNA